MKAWQAGLLGLAGGAALIIGAEVVMGESLLKRIQHTSNSANGYKISVYWLPAFVGQAEAVGITLTQNGQPVPNAMITVMAQKQSGNQTWNLYTDNNGVVIADVSAFHGQAMTVIATYANAAGTTIVQDQARIVVNASKGV